MCPVLGVLVIGVGSNDEALGIHVGLDSAARTLDVCVVFNTPGVMKR